MGIFRGRSARGFSARGFHGLIWLLVCALCLPVFPTRALAADWGAAVTYEADSADGSNADDHKLNDAGTAITVTGDGTYIYTLSGLISGSGDLTKTGAGTLYLSHTDNAYTGATIVSQGVLQISGRNSINPDSLGNAVNGAGSLLETGDGLFVGSSGTGALTITNGGTASAGGYTLGLEAGSSGTVTVSGAGSLLKAGNVLSVGYLGTGALTITGGGKASAGGNIYLGGGNNSSGTVTVSGAGSLLEAGEDLFVGVLGTGVLTITNGGKASAGVSILLGNTNVDSSGTITVSGGRFAVGGPR